MAETAAYIKTDTVLDKILAHTVDVVAQSKRALPLKALQAQVADRRPPLDFAAALKRETVALIAEVKKASPSKGVLIEDFDPVSIAKIYAENGAAAISVLTDERFFHGSLDYLRQIRAAVDVPLLRKEFIIDAYQVYEARAAGADAVLLIVAALSRSQLEELYVSIQSLAMTALVEIHNETELSEALAVQARLVGINNRNLKTFDVDLDTTARLAKLVPAGVTLVAESAISSVNDVRLMSGFGAHAVLVGESLVKSGDMAATVSDFSRQVRS
jgi:indole-3-glycerol phosphate synthase